MLISSHFKVSYIPSHLSVSPYTSPQQDLAFIKGYSSSSMGQYLTTKGLNKEDRPLVLSLQGKQFLFKSHSPTSL